MPAQVGPPPLEAAGITGDLEIRPDKMVALLLAPGVLLTAAMLLQGAPAAAAVIAGPTLLAAALCVEFLRKARVRVTGGAVELRRWGRPVVVPLAAMDRPVVSHLYRSHTPHLHLRLQGGRHVATLSGTCWGSRKIVGLGRHLGAVSVPSRGVSGMRGIERDYPGSLSKLGQHPWLTAYGLLIVLVGVLSLLVRVGPRLWS